MCAARTKNSIHHAPSAIVRDAAPAPAYPTNRVLLAVRSPPIGLASPFGEYERWRAPAGALVTKLAIA